MPATITVNGYDRLIDLVRRPARDFSDAQIARILHRKRIQTPKGLPYSAHRVANLRKTHDIAPGPRAPKGGDDIYTAQQAGEWLGVDRSTVIRFVEAGLLQGAELDSRANLAEVSFPSREQAQPPRFTFRIEGWKRGHR